SSKTSSRVWAMRSILNSMPRRSSALCLSASTAFSASAARTGKFVRSSMTMRLHPATRAIGAVDCGSRRSRQPPGQGARRGRSSNRGRQRTFDFGNLPVSDRVQDELPQLLDFACLDRKELRTAVRDQGLPIQIALPLDPYEGIHGRERRTGGEIEHSHALPHVGMQKTVEALQVLP